MKANLSIWGMYMYNKDLFKDMSIPTQLNRQTLIDNILLECNEMQILYTNWSFLKSAIDAWSAKSVSNWQRIADSLDLVYNPIENYDRQESWTDTGRHTGTVADVGTGSASATRTDATSDSLHHVEENSSELDHDGDRTETISSTVTTEGTEITDGETTGSTTRSTTDSLTHTGSDTIDETIADSTSSSSTNSVNGFNGTLSDTTMSPHDKNEGTSTASKVVDHDGTNTYTDARTGSETGSTSGTNDVTVSTSGTQTTSASNTGRDDFLENFDENKEFTDTKSGSLESSTSESTSNSNTRTNNLVDTLEHTARIHGNIGTVTSQDMILQEQEVAKINVYDIITDEFKKKFCLSVYF